LGAEFNDDNRSDYRSLRDGGGASAGTARIILHSDRGVQYRSSDYQGLLYDRRIQPSMSRKGNCWDNAAMEAFFARLKVESIYAEPIRTKDEAYARVFEYIEVFYNNVRRHSAIDYKSPKQFEADHYARCA
jgi:transposase InsO family protein